MTPTTNTTANTRHLAMMLAAISILGLADVACADETLRLLQSALASLSDADIAWAFEGVL